MTRNASSEFVGIGEAARRIGVHPNSIRRAEREGRTHPARREAVSGERYYSHDDLEALRMYFAK